MTAIFLGSAGATAAVEIEPLVSIQNVNINATRDTTAGSGTGTAIYFIDTDGDAEQATNSGPNSDSIGAATSVNATDWFVNKTQASIGDDWQVRATQTASSGLASFTGTLDVWTTITSEQSWQLQDTGNFVERSSSITLTIEIRDVATSTVQASGSIDLNVLLFGP